MRVQTVECGWFIFIFLGGWGCCKCGCHPLNAGEFTYLYMYLWMPQGYLAAGDAYTWRYDEIIKGVPRKIKIVDDTLLYDTSIEESLFHTWDYLALCAQNGIRINESKFQFCRDAVIFAGLKLTQTGITPSESVLSAITDFPVPKDITGARSWFGLENQVAWAYAISPIMQRFRDLVKHNTTFHWNQTLDTSSRRLRKAYERLTHIIAPASKQTGAGKV